MKMTVRFKDPAFYLKTLMIMSVFAMIFYLGDAHAAGGGGGSTIGDVADNIKDSFSSLAKLITAGSYVAGMGFVLGAIFKFKAHKDNPTQIPIGTPIALLFIGAAMIFLPQIFSIGGATMFGSEGEQGTVEGVDEFGKF